MGRRRKPTHLKLVENSRDRRPSFVRENEPMPHGVLSEPPDYLPMEYQLQWRRTVENTPKGMLKPIDGPLLEAWVFAVVTRQKAMEKLQASSMLVRNRQGNAVQSPYLRIINQQTVIMKSLAVELGFSPAARTNIAIEAEADSDPTDRFFS